MKLLTSDIPIRSAVIAWHPVCMAGCGLRAQPGDIVVLRHLDPRDSQYGKTDGACYVDWAGQPVRELVNELRCLKRVMVRRFGMSPHRIEEAFVVIPEYRRYKTDRDKAR